MQDILIAIWNHDFESLQQASSLRSLVLLLAFILLLESSFVFLPLPGDSLILFVGGLVGLGLLDFYPVTIALCLTASLGSVNAYIQGRLLHETKFMSSVSKTLPDGTLQKAGNLLERYGFLSLFISRFVPFVRVLTPMLMGVSKLSFVRTILISIASSVIWCLTLIYIGQWLMIEPRFVDYQVMISKTLISIGLLVTVVAVIGLCRRCISVSN